MNLMQTITKEQVERKGKNKWDVLSNIYINSHTECDHFVLQIYNKTF